MKTRTRMFVGLLTLLLGAWTIFPTQAAFASGFDFGIRPTNGNNGYFVFTVEPGQAVHDSISVLNQSGQAQVIKIMPVAGHSSVTGGTSLSFDQQDGAAKWISMNSSALNANQVEVPANSQLDIPFDLTVPADAVPGEYAAGFLATSNNTDNNLQAVQPTDPQSSQGSSLQVKVVPQVGLMVMINVGTPASANCKIAIEKLIRDISYARWNLGLQLHNTGSLHFIGSGSLTVRPAAGGEPVLSRSFDVGYFVAGDTILYPLYDMVPPEGQYVAEAVVTDKDNPSCTADYTESFSITGPEKKAADQQQQEFSNQPVLQKAWYENPFIVGGLTAIIIVGMLLAAILFYLLIMGRKKEARK